MLYHVASSLKETTDIKIYKIYAVCQMTEAVSSHFTYSCKCFKYLYKGKITKRHKLFGNRLNLQLSAESLQCNQVIQHILSTYQYLSILSKSTAQGNFGGVKGDINPFILFGLRDTVTSPANGMFSKRKSQQLSIRIKHQCRKLSTDNSHGQVNSFRHMVFQSTQGNIILEAQPRMSNRLPLHFYLQGQISLPR